MIHGESLLQKGWAEIGVVLGGGVTKRGLTHDSDTRAKKALHILQKRYVKKMILSGKCPYGEPFKSEAKGYQDYLGQWGIAKQRMILEEESRDTIGNAVYCKKLFLENKWKKNIVLVTSNYHMKRALMIFSRVFGPEYSFIGVSSHPFILHKVVLNIRQWEYKEIDELLLRTVKPGEHGKAERLIKKYLPMYKS